MGYRRMNINDLRDIYRRLRCEQSIRLISDATGFDRKTIRTYRDQMAAADLLGDSSPESEDELATTLFEMLPSNDRSSPVQDNFMKHKDEIVRLVNRKEDPLKPKSAFIVMKGKYDIPGSYESFKVFMRKNHLMAPKKKQFPRLETEPGQEVQIDYGKCGLITDPVTKKRRVVYGFVAKLSSSRLPYVEFTYSQTQESFVESHINMVEFFGGVPEYMTIDNLKAGVIKPHIYDPQLNRSYAEFAEHYGTFVNPCLPAYPKGKAKVERQVPEVRELFRRLCEIHPTYSLKDLNRDAKDWCRKEYGLKPHGTTGIPPWEAFIEIEQPKLKPLVSHRFEVPVWKPAKVHADQFITVDKKRYSLPFKYRGKTVHSRRTGSLLKIFDENYLFIRQNVITNHKVYVAKGDFPESHEAMMKGEYPRYLIREAAAFGPGSKRLVETILRPHAFLNARRALGILKVVKDNSSVPLLQDVCFKAAERNITNPKQLKIMLEDEQNQQLFDFVPRSSSGEAMVREIRDYFY